MMLTALRDKLSSIKGKVKNEVEKTLRDSSNFAVKEIKHATSKGVDSTGSGFAKYSAMTISLKGSSLVNLKDTGGMLSHMRSRKISSTKFIVGFSGGRAQALASKHMTGTAKIPARHFFDINTKTKKYIKKRSKQAAVAMLK
jgi:hypothetical protein